MDQARFSNARPATSRYRGSGATSTATSHPPTPPREQARRKPAAPAHEAPPRRWVEFAHQKKPTAQRCAVSA